MSLNLRRRQLPRELSPDTEAGPIRVEIEQRGLSPAKQPRTRVYERPPSAELEGRELRGIIHQEEMGEPVVDDMGFAAPSAHFVASPLYQTGQNYTLVFNKGMAKRTKYMREEDAILHPTKLADAECTASMFARNVLGESVCYTGALYEDGQRKMTEEATVTVNGREVHVNGDEPMNCSIGIPGFQGYAKVGRETWWDRQRRLWDALWGDQDQPRVEPVQVFRPSTPRHRYHAPKRWVWEPRTSQAEAEAFEAFVLNQPVRSHRSKNLLHENLMATFSGHYFFENDDVHVNNWGHGIIYGRSMVTSIDLDRATFGGATRALHGDPWYYQTNFPMTAKIYDNFLKAHQKLKVRYFPQTTNKFFQNGMWFWQADFNEYHKQDNQAISRIAETDYAKYEKGLIHTHILMMPDETIDEIFDEKEQRDYYHLRKQEYRNALMASEEYRDFVSKTKELGWGEFEENLNALKDVLCKEVDEWINSFGVLVGNDQFGSLRPCLEALQGQIARLVLEYLEGHKNDGLAGFQSFWEFTQSDEQFIAVLNEAVLQIDNHYFNSAAGSVGRSGSPELIGEKHDFKIASRRNSICARLNSRLFDRVREGMVAHHYRSDLLYYSMQRLSASYEFDELNKKALFEQLSSEFRAIENEQKQVSCEHASERPRNASDLWDELHLTIKFQNLLHLDEYAVHRDEMDELLGSSLPQNPLDPDQLAPALAQHRRKLELALLAKTDYERDGANYDQKINFIQSAEAFWYQQYGESFREAIEALDAKFYPASSERRRRSSIGGNDGPADTLERFKRAMVKLQMEVMQDVDYGFQRGKTAEELKERVGSRFDTIKQSLDIIGENFDATSEVDKQLLHQLAIALEHTGRAKKSFLAVSTVAFIFSIKNRYPELYPKLFKVNPVLVADDDQEIKPLARILQVIDFDKELTPEAGVNLSEEQKQQAETMRKLHKRVLSFVGRSSGLVQSFVSNTSFKTWLPRFIPEGALSASKLYDRATSMVQAAQLLSFEGMEERPSESDGDSTETVEVDTNAFMEQFREDAAENISKFRSFRDLVEVVEDRTFDDKNNLLTSLGGVSFQEYLKVRGSEFDRNQQALNEVTQSMQLQPKVARHRFFCPTSSILPLSRQEVLRT